MNTRNGARIFRDRRLQLQLTQTEVAEKASTLTGTTVFQQEVAKLELDQRVEPTLLNTVAIGAALGFTPDEVVWAYEIFQTT